MHHYFSNFPTISTFITKFGLPVFETLVGTISIRKFPNVSKSKRFEFETRGWNNSKKNYRDDGDEVSDGENRDSEAFGNRT